MKKINLKKAFDRIEDYWSPHIAANVNGQDIRLAKLKGEFEWHRHDNVEEAFLVMKGGFTMRFRDRDAPLQEGDLIVVPAGVEHMPVAEEECWVVLIENAGTRNTGEHRSDRTKDDLPALSGD
ncbi:cupin domain-containing protein [Hyphococcus sp.]|uniref:cupin domain-containing protein n=1 Tax=Hyphococcus sp. TaxID=2038636 RepID=UPI003CCBC56B